MKPHTLLVPVLLLVSACKNGDDDSDGTGGCPADSVDVTVTVGDTDGAAVPGVEVDIDGEPCAGSGTAFVCTAVPGEPNQITASAFPAFQPATGRALVDGADCESIEPIVLRMRAAVK